MTANIIVLLCWTWLAPLHFERHAASGTDNWNQVNKSYVGVCVGTPTDGNGGGATSLPFLLIIGVINISTLLIANIQAYQARTIHVEYSESRYIAMAMVILLITLIMGVPIITLFQYDQPQATFIVFTILIFVTCISILLLIFVPKIQYMQKIKDTSRDSALSRRGSALYASTNASMSQSRMLTIPYGDPRLEQHPCSPSTSPPQPPPPTLKDAPTGSSGLRFTVPQEKEATV